MTIRFRRVPMIPSIAKTLSSLLSLSWPSLSSSFPLVITILVANVFIFRPRLTCNGKEAAQEIIGDSHRLHSRADPVREARPRLGTRARVGEKSPSDPISGHTALGRGERTFQGGLDCPDAGRKRSAGGGGSSQGATYSSDLVLSPFP